MIPSSGDMRQLSALRWTRDRIALRYARGQHVAECKGEKGRGVKPDEATLSRPLRTSPLPVTHALVGDCWQNNRCCLLMEHHSYIYDFMSQRP